MKRVMILLAALLLVLATAAPVAAKGDQQRPFKGTTQGYGMVVPDEDACSALLGLRSVFMTTGRGTHLGRLGLEFNHCTPPGPDLVGTEMTFVAANGDKVFATYASDSVPAVGEEPTVLEIPIDFVIDGGTGRFQGATGGGRMVATIAWPGFEPNYWPTTIVIRGTIAY